MMELMQTVDKKADDLYKVLIVDDEHLARTLLEEYVSKLPDLELAGSCANAMSAMSVMRQQKIDILLTDIEMPELTGVEFVENLPYRPLRSTMRLPSSNASRRSKTWAWDTSNSDRTHHRFLVEKTNV